MSSCEPWREKEALVSQHFTGSCPSWQFDLYPYFHVLYLKEFSYTKQVKWCETNNVFSSLKWVCGYGNCMPWWSWETTEVFKTRGVTWQIRIFCFLNSLKTTCLALRTSSFSTHSRSPRRDYLDRGCPANPFTSAIIFSSKICHLCGSATSLLPCQQPVPRVHWPQHYR